MAVAVSLSSCLKDKAVNLGPGASPPVVEWATSAIQDAPTNAAGNLYRTYARTLAIGSSVTMRLQIDYTGTDPAPSDVVVGIGTNTAAYTAYKAKYGTTAAQLPTTAYTLPASVTIPKGERFADVSVVVNTSAITANTPYWLPIAITSTTSGAISGNYGTVIYVITAK